jgi:hypothetical protein
LSFAALLKYQRVERTALLAASGIVAGLAVATKITAAVNLPILFLYLAYHLYARRTQIGLRGMIAPAVLWSLAAGVMMATVLAFNYVRFGSFFATGYGSGLAVFSLPLWQGLYGLVLSPGKGLFFYSPVLLLSIPAFVYFFRQHRAEASACLGIIAVNLLLFGAYTDWHGDTAWGPRFMVFILPFAVMPIAALLDALRAPARKRWYSVVAVVAVVSFLVQLLGVMVNFDIYPNMGATAAERYYNPAQSPLVGQAQLFAAMLTETRPGIPMPEGAIARFGWFFDPFNTHPVDFWWLYVIHSGMEPGAILLLVVPLVALCLIGIVWAARVLLLRWKLEQPAIAPADGLVVASG